VNLERLSLTGNVVWTADLEPSVRRRARQRLGTLGYAALRTFVEGTAAHRLDLASAHYALAQVVPAGVARQRARRLALWDLWAQAAMAAEDLELLLRALAGWREGENFFDALVLTRGIGGPEYFSVLPATWRDRLRRIVRLPSADQLRAHLTIPEAGLLVDGLLQSFTQVVDDLQGVGPLTPWDLRDALLRYKHGFAWILPEVAPLDTDNLGHERLQRAVARGGFVLWTRKNSGVATSCSDEDLAGAVAITKHCTQLHLFLAQAVLSEVEAKDEPWGVALYGDAAADSALDKLARDVRDWLRRR